MASFESVISGLYDFYIQFITWANTVFYVFTTPLSELLSNDSLPGVFPNIIEFILNSTPLGDESLITIMLGTGFTLFVVITLVKWFLDIVL